MCTNSPTAPDASVTAEASCIYMPNRLNMYMYRYVPTTIWMSCHRQLCPRWSVSCFTMQMSHAHGFQTRDTTQNRAKHSEFRSLAWCYNMCHDFSLDCSDVTEKSKSHNVIVREVKIIIGMVIPFLVYNVRRRPSRMLDVVLWYLFHLALAVVMSKKTLSNELLGGKAKRVKLEETIPAKNGKDTSFVDGAIVRLAVKDFL